MYIMQLLQTMQLAMPEAHPNPNARRNTDPVCS